MKRHAFVLAHPDLLILDAADRAGLTRYLAARGLLAADEPIVELSKAGDGNMNCTLRVVTPRQRLIVKQARPWVEKYDHIDAPWDRSLVEAAFYRAVAACPDLAGEMPRLIDADPAARTLVLEDVGEYGDYTSIYAGAEVTAAECAALTGYLHRLHRCGVPAAQRPLFANRDMRALNHVHIFRFPLREANGLALDGITPGLQALADDLKRDRPYVDRVAALGDRYLADGSALVHGDFFPGSWLQTLRGVAVIDPEFCFLGAGEFDLGVMMAHLLFGDQESRLDDLLAGAADYDRALIFQFAGAELMRRLIGVAQLPMDAALDRKRALLERSRRLVMNP
jgi:5-methylthioribose kinase